MIYYHVKDGKLDLRAQKGLFLGFNKGVKGYKIWRPEDRKVTISRDVTFDESGMVKQVQNKFDMGTEKETP